VLRERYELRTVLGTGAFGVVVRAWDRNIGRDVAIKCIPIADHSVLESVTAEAQALAQVDAREVVHVYDCDTMSIDFARSQTRVMAIIMEFVAGGSLRSWMAGRPSAEQRVVVVDDAAKALEATHAAGIIHRDIKPENILITAQGRARVVDFGLAYRLRGRPVSTQLVPRGQFGLGTMEYMAPEVGRGDATPRSDQFALAMTAWELFSGRLPFDAWLDNWRPHAARDYAGAERLSRKQLRVLGRALRPDPNARFASVAEFRAALSVTHRNARTIAVLAAGAAAAAGLIATTHRLKKRRKIDDNGQ